FESSTFANAVVQNAKESFSAATSLSFESVSAIFTSGAACPEIFEQNVLFDCAIDRKSTRLNSSHVAISYAVFCLKKKKKILYINVCHGRRQSNQSSRQL